jgi:tetratricopeptide (TPR) repeat protein
MEPFKVNIDEISELDLNLAKNDKAVSFVEAISKLSPEDRAQRLKNLQRKIQEGTANLFEEKVLIKLLENRTAEKIRDIRANLPAIETALTQRKLSQTPATKRPARARSAPATPAARAEEYPTQLLEFLATQKPPPRPAKSSEKQISPVIAPPAPVKRLQWSKQDLSVGLGLLVALILAFWYVVGSQEKPPALTTFDQQFETDASKSGLSKGELEKLQAQFDAALRELRLGKFEQGKAELLTLIEKHPTIPQAEDALIAIADTYRQRQNNPDQALKSYQTFTEQYPNSSQTGLVLLKMGFTYEDMEDAARAAEMYRLVVSRYGEKNRIGQLASERLQALKK